MKALEDRGIGRPSTYASIMGTILDRGYVCKKGTALVPTFVAFAVIQLLEQHFGQLVDYDFTARMEDDLDRIAGRRRGAGRPGSRRFYFGDGRHRACTALVDGPARGDRRPRGQLDPASRAADIVVRVGRYGPYLERGERPRERPGGHSRPTS